MNEPPQPPTDDESGSPNNIERLVPPKNAETRCEDADENDRQAEVIELRPGDAPSPEPPAPKAPPRTLFGALLRTIAQDIGRRATRAGQGDSSEIGNLLESAAASAESDDEPVNLTAERLRRKGAPQNPEIDLGATLRDTLQRVLSKHAAGQDESVRIDGEFVREHGASVLPALLGGIAESITASMVGLSAPPSLMRPRSNEGDAGDADGEATAEKAAETPDEHPRLHPVDAADAGGPESTTPNVDVDLLSVLAALIQPPPTEPADPTDPSNDDTPSEDEEPEP